MMAYGADGGRGTFVQTREAGPRFVVGWVPRAM